MSSPPNGSVDSADDRKSRCLRTYYEAEYRRLIAEMGRMADAELAKFAASMEPLVPSLRLYGMRALINCTRDRSV